nr:ORF78 [Acipenserid herpesvirus 1]
MEHIIKTENKQYALDIKSITKTDKQIECVSVADLEFSGQLVDLVCGNNKAIYAGTFKEESCIIKRGRSDTLDLALNEAYWLRQCKHKNVIDLYSITIWHNTVTNSYESQLVTKAYTDLFDVLYGHNNIERELETRMHLPFIFKDVLEGLCYLHSMNIYHRDIKAENVVIDMSCSPYQAKLIDLEQTSMFPWDKNNKFGTLHYSAPEVLAKGPITHPSRIDIWCFGLMLWYAYSSSTDPVIIQGNNARQLLISIRKTTGLLPKKYYKSAELYEDVQYAAHRYPIVNYVELSDNKPLNQILSVTLQADPVRRCEGYVISMMDFFCDL